MLIAKAVSRTHKFTPADLPSIKGWWVADDLAGADGSAVASWVGRITGQTLTQATGAKQPILKTGANGLNGRNVVRFASASSQTMSCAKGNIPATAPLTVIYVLRPTTTSGVQGHVSVYNAGATGSFYCRASSTTLQFFANTGTGGTAYSLVAGAPQIVTMSHDGTNWAARIANSAASTGALTAPSAAGTTLTFGSVEPAATDYLNGDMAEVIICNTVLTTAERLAVHLYLYRKYGIEVGYNTNAAAAVTTPTDAGGAGTCAEISIVKFASAWNSFTHWAAFVPYNGGVATENPTIAASNDGNTWVTPGTVPVPLVPARGTGNNADPALLDNTARDSKLYCFFKVENDSSNQGTWVTSTTDGSTWSAPVKVIAGVNNDDTNEPKVVYDSGSSQYWMYHLDLSVTPHTFTRRTSSSPASGYSARTQCTFNRTLPALNGRDLWHNGQVIKVGNKWVTAFSAKAQDNNNPASQWLASSTDGLAWTLAEHPVLATVAAFVWDRAGIYRLTLQDAGDGLNLYGWYSTYSRTGLTAPYNLSQRITIPLGEIP